ncbi:hypothetical protein J437_LFUL003007 [Ladona fulva]|uniref:Mediator of RNA polymerase II transcription subunit 30 n=1 Tax=Ladona fulva TaxID=123851 RepID=A0A8K0JV22_LADFU|nr:hypothetical protein J437_LFUL003007 [Ladona fulva]
MAGPQHSFQTGYPNPPSGGMRSQFGVNPQMGGMMQQGMMMQQQTYQMQQQQQMQAAQVAAMHLQQQQQHQMQQHQQQQQQQQHHHLQQQQHQQHQQQMAQQQQQIAMHHHQQNQNNHHQQYHQNQMQQPQQQQQQPPQQPGVAPAQSKEFNTASLCRWGQETVQDIVSRTQEVFQTLKAIQPPNGTAQGANAANEKKAKIQEQLKTIRLLFKRLRLIYEKCNENCQGMEYTHIEQVILKNRHLKEIIDHLRRIIWEINTMLTMRRS